MENAVDFARLLKEKSQELGITLDGAQIAALVRFKDLLLDWNRKMNLTAVTDDAGFLVKHYLDSLSIARYIPRGARVIDIGTGAGFPGVPLLIARPDITVTLMDSLKKRLVFLEECARLLNLTGVDILHARAEDAGRSAVHRESYDIAVSRAVASLALLSEYCLPFVKTGGSFIAMKGPNAQSEVASALEIIRKLGGELSRADEIKLPGEDILGEPVSRTIIIISKLRQTNIKYPRNPAELTKIYKKNP